MADEKRDDDAVFRLDTVPPPASDGDGDGDAYNAPTRVGPVSADAWVELIRQADAQGKKNAELDKRIAESGPVSTPPNAARRGSSVDAEPASKPASASKPAPAAKPAPASAPVSTPLPSPKAELASATPSPAEPTGASSDVPRLYNEDVDESGAATLLHHSAKKVQDASLRADASVFGDAPPSSGPAASEPPPASVLHSGRGSRVRSYAILGAILIGLALLLWLVRP